MASFRNDNPGVVLTSFALSRAQTVHGSMPSKNFAKPKVRRQLDLQFFFEEFKQIREARAAAGADREQEEEEEDTKLRQEGEEETRWLKEVGLSSLASYFEENKELNASDVDAETSKMQLTVPQQAAVRRRVDTLNATIRRKRQMQIVEGDASDLRQMFLLRKDEQEDKECSGTQRNQSEVTIHVTSPATNERHSQLSPDEAEVDAAVNGLPDVPIESVPEGLTRIDDLSVTDVESVKQRALMELTALLESNDIQMKVRKAPKRKYRESGVFGVPIMMMLSRDRLIDPMTRTPFFVQQIIGFLEDMGIRDEGILRVPGASARVRVMQQELEGTFLEGKFSWDGRRTNDASTLLKQFLRDLPYPLLTHEYLHIFASVEDIADFDKKIKALNLLVLLLPPENRDTLKMLLAFLDHVVALEDQNKMTLNNVAMIMAPNLFYTRGGRRQDLKEAQSDLKMAACTCNVVRMLIRYHNVLWIVPQHIMVKIRGLNDVDPDKRRIARMARRAVHRKKGSPPQKRMEEKNGISEAPTQERKLNIIRVQSPHFSKVSMCVELTSTMTAGDIVSKYRKKSFENMALKGVGPKQHPVFERRMSFEKPTAVVSTPKPLDNHHLFEVGGNIGERCLEPNAIITEVLKVNPNAEWVIKQRELDL